MRVHPLLLGFITLLQLGFVAAQTPAGTLVRSQAVAIVNEEAYFSNEASTLVRAVCGVSLAPTGSAARPAHRLTALAGSNAYLPYVITNTGNARHAYPLTLWQDAGNDWIAPSYTYYVDTNHDGHADASEEATSGITLDAGQQQAVVLEVATPVGAVGTATVSPVTGCPGASATPGSIASITIQAGASLLIEKSSTPATVTVGDTMTFTIDVTNAGADATADPVVITDLLDTPDLEGITYQAGSVSSTIGLIEYSDGLTWSDTPPAAVHGLRVTVPSLAQDERVRLTFDATVHPGATPGPRGNTVTATSGGTISSTHYAFAVAPQHEHAFGPEGNSEALPGGEGSRDDEQGIGPLIVDQPACLTIALKNTGSSNDTYDLEAVEVLEGMRVSFRTVAGTPLPLPVALQAGEEADVRVCVTAATATAESSTLTLRATSGRTGRANRTRILVHRVDPATAVTLHLTGTPTPTLTPGATLTYELRVTNDSTAPLTNTTVTLPIPDFQGSDPPRLAFDTASHDGRHDASRNTVTWRAGTLEVGESTERTATFTLPHDDPAGSIYTLSNAFTVRSDQIVDPLSSNTVDHTYPGYDLLATLTIQPDEVRLGEETAFTLTLTNPAAYPLSLELHTTLPHGITYVPGSGRIDIGNQHAAIEPNLDEQELRWDLTDASMVLGPAGSPNAEATLRYSGLTTPQTRPSLTAIGWGTGSTIVNGVPVAFRSNEASARAHLGADTFTNPEGLLTGRVFLDLDEDRTYERGFDTPLRNARIVLGNGWQTTTDEHGLYAFRDLQHGPWLVLLDPNSAPFPAPLGTRQQVHVRGIHVLDFPLEAPTGTAGTQRSTTLRYGPVTLHKRMDAAGAGTRVTITIESSEPLEDVTILDPQPDGTHNTWHLDLLEGSHEVTYDLPSRVPMSDPNVRWKDPYR